MINIRSKLLHTFCSTKDQIANAQKYIIDNVQSKEWIHYMHGKYLPKQIQPAFYTMHWLNH